MFCPRCAAALSGRVEFCANCRADLRPLVATGFFAALPPPVGSAPSEAEAVTAPGIEASALTNSARLHAHA